MPLFGEIFLSEIIRKPVYDPKGEVVGKIRDIIVVKGEPLPKVSALIIQKKDKLYRIRWEDINLFNKKVISTNLHKEDIEVYQPNEIDLLAFRDIVDKQIVDVNGVKVVKVNDIKLEGYDGSAILVAVDIGKRWKFRRYGAQKLNRIFEKQFPSHLISWNYIQPLKPKLDSIALTVPRQMVSQLHPAD
ncbi:MAG: PRC-barrel domain-containing protein, partial [Thermodesulfovibrionales bacterium]|nr:PRC-barrel domain-containing protein [Thermodesulfovibrionales bacterium]